MSWNFSLQSRVPNEMGWDHPTKFHLMPSFSRKQTPSHPNDFNLILILSHGIPRNESFIALY